MKTKILATGLTGLVGSRLTELLGGAYEFENLSRETGVNILDKQLVLDVASASDAPIVLHLAAKTNVDGCELDKEKDKEILNKNLKEQEETWKNEQTAWAVNVFGTQSIVEA